MMEIDLIAALENIIIYRVLGAKEYDNSFKS